MNNYESRPIIALDFSSAEEVQRFLAQFPLDEKLYVKVGMELFYQEGPDIVRYIKSLGHAVFVDLKLHDIPNTVKSAMKVLAKLGVAIVNVHAAGGIEMMKAAKQGLEEGTPAGEPVPKLIAVTQLTSTSEEQMQHDQLIQVPLQESVRHYAKCAEKAGLAGVVCSAHEATMIHEATSPNFVCLTPGIRPKGSAVGDQKRVMDPAAARKAGANYIVVGRPVTQAENPYESYIQIKKEWNDQL